MPKNLHLNYITHTHCLVCHTWKNAEKTGMISGEIIYGVTKIFCKQTKDNQQENDPKVCYFSLITSFSVEVSSLCEAML